MAAPVLVVPGIGNSGPRHWQSRWEQDEPGAVRIVQRDWDHPARADWVAALEAAVRRLGPDTVIVAHSLGCLAVAHWAAGPHAPVKGALLVAVPDPLGPAFPAEATGFAPLPATAFAFPGILVASRDDPYAGFEQAAQQAARWGIRLVDIGAAGHINADSGLGDWPQGRALLRELQDG